MDDESLTLLLRGGHVTPAERSERGIRPHPPLRVGDLARRVARLVREEGSFPRPWRPHVPGEAVVEGGVIERRGPLRYVYRYRRHRADDPFVVAEERERTFVLAVSAARHYLRWDLNLPGELDGWTVV